MAPLQHGRGARNIADVCRGALRLPVATDGLGARRAGRRGCRVMRVAVVIQAASAPPLPGKVLLPGAGATLLERMIERVAAARTPRIVVATTTQREDQAARLGGRGGGRGWCAAIPPTCSIATCRRPARPGADVVVKIPSDCPLI